MIMSSLRSLLQELNYQEQKSNLSGLEKLHFQTHIAFSVMVSSL